MNQKIFYNRMALCLNIYTKMNYNLYDILTINSVDYLIASTVFKNKYQYFLLIETDENEELKFNNIKIMKQSVYNNLDPEMLYPITEEEEFEEIKQSLYEAMSDEIKEV